MIMNWCLNKNNSEGSKAKRTRRKSSCILDEASDNDEPLKKTKKKVTDSLFPSLPPSRFEINVICSFADDSTLTISRSDPEELSPLIEKKYKDIARYMNANKLVLNSDKTHLLVMATPHQHIQHQNFGITLNTGTEIIEPIYSEKLLGGNITNDFKFNEHLKENENSVFRSLTSRVNALSKISRVSSFKTRKMIANGIVMSKLVYLIQWWGGCSSYLIDYLQVLQTRAARLVTRNGWHTPTDKMLRQCGWLSVRQLVLYHSLILVFKIRQEAKSE